MTFIEKRVWMIVLILSIVSGVAVRTIGIGDRYIVDFHSWRQADTAAFTHGYLVNGLRLFDPQVDRYPCEHRNSPFGRVEAELPIVSWVAAIPLATIGVKHPPAWYLRVISILFYLGTCIYLFLLVQRAGESNIVSAVTVLVFSALPISIFFTRTVQPDGPSLFLTTGFIYHLLRWLDLNKHRDGLLSAMFASLVFLQKISNGFLLFPSLYLIISSSGFKRSVLSLRYWMWGIALLIPVVAWYAYARTLPWTFGIWNKHSAPSQWIDIGTWKLLMSRVAFDILTWTGIALLFVGFTKISSSRAVRLAGVWLLAIALYFLIMLPAHKTHLYYQLPMALPASIVIAVAAVRVFQHSWTARVVLSIGVAIFAWTTKDALQRYHKDDTDGLMPVIELLDQSVPNESYIVSTSRDPRLFYNAGIRGWFLNTSHFDHLLQCMNGISQNATTKPKGGPRADYLLLEDRHRNKILANQSSKVMFETQFQQLGSAKGFSLWHRHNTASVH